MRAGSLARAGALFSVIVLGSCSSSPTHESSRSRSVTSTSASTSTATSTTTTVPALPASAVARLQRTLDEWHRNAATPGAIVGIKLGEHAPVFAVTGEADRNSHTPMVRTDAFRVGSISKMFVGALALKLSEEGRLDLDATIDRWLPDFPDANRITVRELLTHTSGLAAEGSDTGVPGPHAVDWTKFIGAHLDHAFTPEEIIAFVRGRPLLAPPGTGVHYSNVNTILLGYVVSKITGTDLADALHRELLGPLGLADTYYAATEHREPAPVPRVWRVTPSAPLIDESAIPDTGIVTALGAAGAIVSTPHDLIRSSDAFLRARARGQADLRASSFRLGEGGTGLAVLGFARDGFCVFLPDGCPPNTRFVGIGGSGAVPGGSAIVLYDPVGDFTIVALANSDQVDLGALVVSVRSMLTG